MANLKSSKKDARRIARRNVRNLSVRSRLKTLDKKVKSAAAEKSSDLASTASAYVSALDKAVKKGVIHANKAARQKAAVAKLQKL